MVFNRLFLEIDGNVLLLKAFGCSERQSLNVGFSGKKRREMDLVNDEIDFSNPIAILQINP